jgi:hypothetical protein
LGQENGECFGFISISSVNSTNFAILGKKFAQFSISQNSKVPVGGATVNQAKSNNWCWYVHAKAMK